MLNLVLTLWPEPVSIPSLHYFTPILQHLDVSPFYSIEWIIRTNIIDYSSLHNKRDIYTWRQVLSINYTRTWLSAPEVWTWKLWLEYCDDDNPKVSAKTSSSLNKSLARFLVRYCIFHSINNFFTFRTCPSIHATSTSHNYPYRIFCKKKHFVDYWMTAKSIKKYLWNQNWQNNLLYFVIILMSSNQNQGSQSKE